MEVFVRQTVLSRKGAKYASGVGTALAIVAGVAAFGGPVPSSASSHREAPLISGDPRADNTDVYAFVSPDDATSVTMIANWIPFEEPNGGPNFFSFAEDTRYNIKVDNDGDALPDLTYTWVFTTVIRNPGQFLYNTGQVTTVDDLDLNYYQTYDLTLTPEGLPPVTLLNDAIAAPSLVGPASIPNYAPLVDGATYDLPGGGQSYVGQADDPFFLDLRVFDLLYGGDLSEIGEDSLAGYNVNAVAIQLPKTALAGLGDPAANPVIGVWSTTDRRSARAADGTTVGDPPFVQVSRLGNPLINEVVFPLALKDAFNSIPPNIDATIPSAVDAVTNPILPPLVQAIYGIPAPATPRNDLEEIFLQGVSADNAGLGGVPASVLPVDLNGHDLNTNQATLQPSEQLRLNMSIAPSAQPNRLGLLAGQFDGFPNGRRLGDDVIDIALQVMMGAAQTGQIVQPLARGEYVDRNDRDFRPTFPYLALPHSSGVNQGPDRPPRASEFVTVNPDRVLDTRPENGPIGYAGVKPTAGQTITLDVTGIGTSMVPTDAKAVAVNLTATHPGAAGFLTAYNCDNPRPNASNVNVPGAANASASNMSVVGVSAAGTICIYTVQPTHVIADISGYVPSTSGMTPAIPERLLETRVSDGQVGYVGAKPTAGQTITLDVTAVGTNQVPNGSKAAFLNVTSVNAAAPGFITVYACDKPRPTTSALNYGIGEVIPNLTLAPIAADGTVCVFTNAGTDILVDLVGVVPAGSEYTAAGPQRIFETRAAAGLIGYTGAKPIADQVLEVQVSGVGAAAVPASASTVFLNVTTTDENPVGFATVFPCGTQLPDTSSGNFRGSTTAHFAASSLGTSGRVCIYVSDPTHVVVDLVGFLPGIGITT